MQKSLKNRYFQNKRFGLELWFSLTWLKPLMISWNCLNTSSHACSQVFINLLPSPGTLARGILTGPHGELVFPSLHPWLLGKGDEWFNVMFGHLCPPCWSAQCRNDRPWGLVLPSNPGMNPPPGCAWSPLSHPDHASVAGAYLHWVHCLWVLKEKLWLKLKSLSCPMGMY